MGFEFVYAYLENLRVASTIAFGAASILIAFLLYVRFDNEMDTDDWINVMMWAVPTWMFLGLFVASPGLDHIRQVNIDLHTVTKPVVVQPATAKETTNEVLIPIDLHGSIGVLCSGTCR